MCSHKQAQDIEFDQRRYKVFPSNHSFQPLDPSIDSHNVVTTRFPLCYFAISRSLSVASDDSRT